MILVALERLPSIEGADEIRIDVTFLRGKAPLPGELSAQLTEGLTLADLRLPVVSDGPIFSLAREKIGEKRVLGRV